VFFDVIETLFWTQALFANEGTKAPKLTGHSLIFLPKSQGFAILGNKCYFLVANCKGGEGEPETSNSFWTIEKGENTIIYYFLQILAAKRKKMFVHKSIIQLAQYYNHFLYTDVIINIEPENQIEDKPSPPIYCQRSILKYRSNYFKGNAIPINIFI
jgi:hypothetical protein